MAKSNRTALLIRCSVEEAERIRAAAQSQRRSLSGYVLHALANRLAIEERLRTEQQSRQTWRLGK